MRTGPARPVPNHLRDRHRPGAEAYGPYRYPHDSPDAVVEQRYLPDGLERGAFFSAGPRGWEAEHQARLDAIRSAQSPPPRDPTIPLAGTTRAGSSARHAPVGPIGSATLAQSMNAPLKGVCVSATTALLAVLLVCASALCGVAIWALTESVKTARSARQLADDLDARLVPLLDKADVTVDAMNAELLRIDQIVTRVEEVTDRVSDTSRVVAAGRQRARRDGQRHLRPRPPRLEDPKAAPTRQHESEPADAEDVEAPEPEDAEDDTSPPLGGEL